MGRKLLSAVFNLMVAAIFGVLLVVLLGSVGTAVGEALGFVDTEEVSTVESPQPVAENLRSSS